MQKIEFAVRHICRLKDFMLENNHWHVNKRSSVIICKFCETKIPIWENPKYCPNCLDGK